MNLAQFLNSLSIEDAGELTWDMIIEAKYDTVEKINEMSINDLAVIGEFDGKERFVQTKRIGEKTAIKIWNSLHSNRVQKLLPFWHLWVKEDPPMDEVVVFIKDKVKMSDSLRIEIEEDESEESELKMDLRGKKVLFTGAGPFSRNTLTAVLKRNGAIVQDNIRKDTEVLILADLDSNSNKTQKARKWGIQMVTYEDVFRV